MKSLKQIREASGGKEAYQKFFNSILKRFGVGSPAELEGDAKKKFYDAIDAGWDGDNEKPEPGDKKNENTDDFKSDEDVPDDKGNYTMGDMAESPAIALKVAAAIDKKNEKKKSVKEIRVKPVDEKMGMCEQCGTMHEEGGCPQSDMDMSDLDPDTKGMKEAKTVKLNRPEKKIFDLAMKAVARSNDAAKARTKRGVEKYMDYEGMDLIDDITGVSLNDDEKNNVYNAVRDALNAKIRESVEDEVKEGANSAQLKKAQAIASKNSGDMEAAIAEIEKIKKGLSDDKKVMAMLKKANEDVNEGNRFSVKLKGDAKSLWQRVAVYKQSGKAKNTHGDKEWDAVVDKMAAQHRDDNHARISPKDIAAVKQAVKHESVSEAVSVDRRTLGFKEAMKRRAEAKAKREAKKIKDAKTQAKNDMASIDANYAYDGEVASILADANAKIMGEDAPANAASSGAVDMNPTGKSKKKEKENLMAKYGY